MKRPNRKRARYTVVPLGDLALDEWSEPVDMADATNCTVSWERIATPLTVEIQLSPNGSDWYDFDAIGGLQMAHFAGLVGSWLRVRPTLNAMDNVVVQKHHGRIGFDWTLGLAPGPASLP